MRTKSNDCDRKITKDDQLRIQQTKPVNKKGVQQDLHVSALIDLGDDETCLEEALPPFVDTSLSFPPTTIAM